MNNFRKTSPLIESFDEYLYNKYINESNNFAGEMDVNDFYDIFSNNEWLDENIVRQVQKDTGETPIPGKITIAGAVKKGVERGVERGKKLQRDEFDKTLGGKLNKGVDRVSNKFKNADGSINKKNAALAAGGAVAIGTAIAAIKKKNAQRKAEKAAAAGQPVNASLSFAAIGAGAIMDHLYENNQTIDNNTYLLSYMNEDQMFACMDVFENYVETYGYNEDFINECINDFLIISNEIWDEQESYITEGADENDTSMIEESLDLLIQYAENTNRVLEKKMPTDQKVGLGIIGVGAALTANRIRNLVRTHKKGKALSDEEKAELKSKYALFKNKNIPTTNITHRERAEFDQYRKDFANADGFKQKAKVLAKRIKDSW